MFLGIDFGTSFSQVSTMYLGQPLLLLNPGEYGIPSEFYYDRDCGILIGQDALDAGQGEAAANLVTEVKMAIERTFSIIKPTAVAKNVIGNIFARFEAAGFKIVGTKMLHLTVEQARGFYAEHDGKPFFDGLVEFMTSGPFVVSVLEGENAVQRHRDLLGATNPANALAGTLRADYADSLTENGTHGSDSVESAAREIAYFFGEGEVCPRTR